MKHLGSYKYLFASIIYTLQIWQWTFSEFIKMKATVEYERYDSYRFYWLLFFTRLHKLCLFGLQVWYFVNEATSLLWAFSLLPLDALCNVNSLQYHLEVIWAAAYVKCKGPCWCNKYLLKHRTTNQICSLLEMQYVTVVISNYSDWVGGRWLTL